MYRNYRICLVGTLEQVIGFLTGLGIQIIDTREGYIGVGSEWTTTGTLRAITAAAVHDVCATVKDRHTVGYVRWAEDRGESPEAIAQLRAGR